VAVEPLALVEMTDADYDRYLERVVAKYAGEGAKAIGIEPEEAVERAHAQIARLLPEGRRTPGQFLRNLVRAEEVIGVLWFADRLEGSPRRVFLYDIFIDEDLRGQGLGSAAMALFEDEARRIGADEVALHVFTHNTGAVRLYERLGYRATMKGAGGIRMAKRIDLDVAPPA
jgi:ribosomal protein S18 acetylase RimI-like enzyme